MKVEKHHITRRTLAAILSAAFIATAPTAMAAPFAFTNAETPLIQRIFPFALMFSGEPTGRAEPSKMSTARIVPWNIKGGLRKPSHACFWMTVSWYDMTPAEQWAWAQLGWSEAMWTGESDASPSTESYAWDDLSSTQQSLLVKMGYNASAWNDSDCS